MKMPKKCPSCDGRLIIAEFCCSDCRASVRGEFDLSELSTLPVEEENFLRVFLAARGSVKEVGAQLGISYPTVKARLESLLNSLGLGSMRAAARERRLEVLQRLERGEIKAGEAVAQLRRLEE
ncbi:MAG: hypothetical protein CVU79_03100 [Elusimicrobia bacterium HGW-Elusimicrobia-3]|nr:MAG: hypothetical protein CVU79_03100 [Elusimicrobia bacterium HGW-Elusimicrobia-3]